MCSYRGFSVVCVLLCVSLCHAEQKARVFITDSKSWEIAGGGGGSSGAFGTAVKGGARPQTAEIIKTFGERCPNVLVNNRAEKADYVVLLDHEGGKGWVRRDNKVAVFNYEGDSIMSSSTRSLGSAVKDACEAIQHDWKTRGSNRPNQSQSDVQNPESAATEGATIHISSEPDGGDIEVDGDFVGNAPSDLRLAPGEYTIRVQKDGYETWEKRLKVGGGEINLKATLREKE